MYSELSNGRAWGESLRWFWRSPEMALQSITDGEWKMRSAPWQQGPREAAKYHRSPILYGPEDEASKNRHTITLNMLWISQLLAQHKMLGFGQVRMQWKPAGKLSMTKINIHQDNSNPSVHQTLTMKLNYPLPLRPGSTCSATLQKTCLACQGLSETFHFRDTEAEERVEVCPEN